jgi:hypothetical protein
MKPGSEVGERADRSIFRQVGNAVIEIIGPRLEDKIWPTVRNHYRLQILWKLRADLEPE